jgi:hypothetical protein
MKRTAHRFFCNCSLGLFVGGMAAFALPATARAAAAGNGAAVTMCRVRRGRRGAVASEQKEIGCTRALAAAAFSGEHTCSVRKLGRYI